MQASGRHAVTGCHHCSQHVMLQRHCHQLLVACTLANAMGGAEAKHCGKLRENRAEPKQALQHCSVQDGSKSSCVSL